MALSTYASILRKHLLLIIVAMLVGLGLGYLTYSRTPATYASVVQFYISTPLPEGTNAQSAGQFAQSRVNSYIQLLSSEELGKRVAVSSGVQLTPRQIADRISATADINTVLLTVTVTDTSSERSLEIAQGVADTFGGMVDDLDNQGRKSQVVVVNTVSGPSLLPGPVSPEPLRYLIAGLGIGLLASVLYALLRTLLDTKVRTAEDAAHVAGVPVLGSIPYDSGIKDSVLIVGEEAGSTRAEAYRKLRTSLQFVAAADNAASILVTSALPQEGKSVTAVNLALSVVESGRRALLIDADMRKPMVAHYLDVENEVGLSSVLAGQVAVEDAILPWGGEGLWVLPSGPIPPNPSELLGSERMRTLIERLTHEYDQLILDAPPVLPVTDAAVASGQTDVVLIVARAGHVNRADLATAMSVLRTVHARVAGVLLNMLKVSRTHQEFGQTYYREEHVSGPEVRRAASGPLKSR